MNKVLKTKKKRKKKNDSKWHTNNCGLQVHKDGPGDMLSGSSLTEESVERVVCWANSFGAANLAVGLDAVLQAVQLPAGVADLSPSLAHMDGDTLALQGGRGYCSAVLFNEG